MPTMGVWDNIVDGFKSGMMLKGPNYVQNERAKRSRELQGLMAIAVRRAYQEHRTELARGPRQIQYRDGDFTVKVRSDYDRDRGCDVTDILIIPRKNNPRGSEQHVVIDDHGNTLLNEWHEK
jgi:hypothetical protein